MKLSNCQLLVFVACLIAGCTSTAVKSNTANTTNAQSSSNLTTVASTMPAENKAQTTATPPAENKAQTTDTAPDALLKDLYKTHEKDSGAIVQGKNRAILDKYFDKNLADLIWKDMTTNKEEVGVIDFDIFYNAQDADVKNLVVGTPKIDGDKASAVVTFENFKEKNTLTYSLIKEKGAWKISDIDYGQGNTLLKYFKEDSK